MMEPDPYSWHELAPKLVAEYLAEAGPGSVVEIGVWRGELSERLLKIPSLTHLHLVDPWHPSMLRADGKWYYCGPGTDVKTMDDAYAHVQEVTAIYPGRVTLHRMASVDGAKEVEDGSLAVVIIDALHFENTVMDDIGAWLPKLRTGGLMIGDDMSDYYPGVQLGVENIFGNQYKCLGQTWWTFPDHVRRTACCK